MKQIEDLTSDEKKELYNKAFTYSHDNSELVHNSFNKKTPSIAPSGSDMFHPELWKDIHWSWFFKYVNDDISDEIAALSYANYIETSEK